MRELENAAENVRNAMRSFDAHRHDGAPSLERDYRRALEAYFMAAERVLGRELPSADDADEDEQDVELVARGQSLRAEVSSVVGHYAAARRALRLARMYRAEPGTSGRRERECVQTALRHREAIHALRLQMRPPAMQLQLPGLAKTRPQIATPQRSAKTG